MLYLNQTITAMSDKKLILVIGATGAQGLAVIDALLEPGVDGSHSPYTIRALTRNPDSKRAQQLQAKGVECVKGDSLFSAFLCGIPNTVVYH